MILTQSLVRGFFGLARKSLNFRLRPKPFSEKNLRFSAVPALQMEEKTSDSTANQGMYHTRGIILVGHLRRAVRCGVYWAVRLWRGR
jgi:hypothetical protein